MAVSGRGLGRPVILLPEPGIVNRRMTESLTRVAKPQTATASASARIGFEAERIMEQNAAIGLLCVNPDPTLLRYLQSLFKDLAVYTATDAAQALLSVQNQPDIGVMVADPQVTSSELVKGFIERLPDGVIVWLGHRPPDPSVEGPATEAVFRMLQRPVREGELVQTVRQALGVYRLRHKRLQSARAERLAEVERLKDELVMIAAHDIRAPLSVILGYCDILLGHEPGVSESGREMLERIQASSKRLLTMVDNVLNLAALQDGRLEIQLAPTRIGDVVREVVDSLAGMIDQRQVECRIEIEGDDRLYDLDRTKLAAVLQNLVSNAVKFNRPHGTVEIKAIGAPDLVSFEVHDSGPGMTPEQAERAFQKFVRFAPGSAAGSGLGLAIAKGFVELLGGTISLETHRGNGCIFRFTMKPGVRAGEARSVLQ